MATESLIVEVVHFVCTKECVADPCLFEAVRNIVQPWQNKGMKAQYWGTIVEKPDNICWVLFWQSRAHAAAFAADPEYPEFVQRRQSLATAPVRDLHVPMSGDPQSCIEAPVGEFDFYKTHDTSTEESHELARRTVYHLQSLQPPGFHGASHGVSVEDPTIGVYLSGWDAVEDHMRMGMEEGHEKFREIAEETMSKLIDVVMTHVIFKKHGA